MQPEAGDAMARAGAALGAAFGPLLAQLIVFPVFGFCLSLDRAQRVTAIPGALLVLFRSAGGGDAGSRA